VSYAVPVSVTSPFATVGVQGSVTLTSGDVVAVQVSGESIAVLSPHGPTPVSNLEFGTIQAARSHQRDAEGVQLPEPKVASGELMVRAGTGGPGRLCFVSAAGESEAGEPIAVAPIGAACRNIPASTTVAFPFQASIATPRLGALSGSIHVTTSWEYETTTYPWTVSVRGSVIVPPGDPIVDQETLWLLVIGSFLGVALLWILLSWYTARLPKRLSIIQGFKIPLTVGPLSTDFEQETTDQPRPFPKPLWRFLKPKGPRNAVVDDPESPESDLRLHAPIRVFRTQDLLTWREGYLAHGTLGRARRRRSAQGRLEHRIQGQWVFTVPLDGRVTAESESIKGELYVFVLTELKDTASSWRVLLASAEKDLIGAFDVIRSRLCEMQPTPARELQTVDAQARSDDSDGWML